MRWLSSAAAVQLLCLLDIAIAIPDYGFGVDNRLEPRREALLLYKRQDNPFCREGYFQCPPEFGGGCCADGRKCATRDCPAIRPGQEDIPNAFTDTRPPQTFTNPPPTPLTARPSSTSETAEEVTSTEAPETTTAARTTAPPTTSDTETETEAPTTTGGPSTAEAESTGTNTESQSGTATNAADAAETTTSSPAADGTLYTPMGISSGAIVGIVFAGITGAVIVGLVLWRAIIGIRHPRKKGKRPPPPMAMAAGGAAAAGSGGVFGGNRRIFGAFKSPFGGKKSGPGASEAMMARSADADADDEDNAPMSQSAAAMGFGPQPAGSEGAPPYAQDRSSLEDQDTSYNRAAYGGGDLGYRGVSSYDRQDDDTQGLFPRSGGFPNR
ncbi:hypothetical protein TWF481_000734 [Arthrobotrys musiformis]|uniref:Uncharacterized protein n=1 Tax=Arthrobotrys musiformis TaxID=47236 RepID=A0AAV9WQ96_9PEZI